MIEVKEVKTKKQQKEFLDFPLKLYKSCPYYSPALYLDEKNIFKHDYFYYETCEAKYFNCYKDGMMAGRIGAVLQRTANEVWKQRRVRFTRLDLIDDLEVCQALLKAVEDFAKERGMDQVFGPMGFSDMEKEGLLVEGFEEPTTYSENYNYAYYKDLLEKCGYGKDVDWIAHHARCPKDIDLDKIERVVNGVMKRNNLHLCTEKSTNKILDRYGKQFFDVVEESYRQLYQTVPFTEKQIVDMIDSFRLILRSDFLTLILNENDEVVCFALMFPYIADILNRSGGHLYPLTLIRLLKAIKHPHVMEFGLIGVKDSYRNTGIAWAPMAMVVRLMKEGKIDHCETNLTLEDNVNILNFLSKLELRDHRKVRTYIKTIA